ncbi:MAG: apolipoprotein N-acyltransferase [Crocinitomicaceae bacterium]|nr:apolipoprotein N-acyltransferase [Crocinitomicaceae bacterium]
MKLKVLHLFLLAILGGVLLGISFPFTGGITPLSFIALIPLFIINFELNKKSKRRFWIRFGTNYLYFVIFNAITTWWIYYASESGMYMAVFANSILMLLPWFFTAFISRQLGENKGILSLLVLWLCFEHLHFYWELSWPWLNIGHILGTSPKLIQWYEYSGVLGGSLWILLVNIVIYLLIRNIWFRKESVKVQTPIFIFLGLAITIPIVSSFYIYYNYEEKVDPIEIVVVQPNIEAHTEKFVLPRDYQLEKMFLAAESKLTASTDLIVFPETAIPYGMDEMGLEQNQSILMVREFIKKHDNIPVLIGADTYKIFKDWNSVACRPIAGSSYWYENYNTALMFDGNMPLEIYHKEKLVLGGEKLPFIDMFPFLAKYSVELGGTAGVLGFGNDPAVFEARGVNYAPLICYESVYGDFTSIFVRKGADIICVITNDGWWRDTPGYKQHRMFSQIRAIENRRSVARSANTGISCFIDQKGEIIEELGWNEYGAMNATLNKNTEFTIFTIYGDIIGRISTFLSLAMILYAFVERIKKTGVMAKIKSADKPS